MIRDILLGLFAQGLDTSALPNNNDGDPASAALAATLKIVFGVAGAIAMLIVVISGFRYIISAGDPAKMAQAKKSILYAVIGLAVSMAAFSIVALVVKGVG
jgi:hypothetical protein